MEFTSFINQIVPPGETLAIPTNRVPFKYTSKETFLQYFVYPRKVVEIEDRDIPKAKWLIITSEESPDHKLTATWPEQTVFAKRFYIYNFNSKETVTYLDSYNPDTFKEEKPWGLIQK
jgi:hypothetical protein